MKFLLEIHHGIGDIVQYTGLVKSIRTYDKDAFIGIVLNKEAYKTLLTFDRDINEIYIIDFRGTKVELLKTIKSIRQEHFDYMICSSHSRQKSMEFMAIAFGAKKVVGSKLSRLSKINKKYINIFTDSMIHVVKQNYNILLGLNKDFLFFEPYLVCPEPPYKLRKHTVGLCIGTSIQQKTWPLERYVALGEKLEQKGYTIALFGGKKEQRDFDEYGYKNDRWINLLGKTDLISSASECARCDLVVGGDTGLMHMAAAVGVRTLTLFSCSEPLTHVPFSKQSYFYYVPTSCQFCFGSETMKSCNDYKCLTTIKTDIIFEIADGILSGLKDTEKYKFSYEIN